MRYLILFIMILNLQINCDRAGIKIVIQKSMITDVEKKFLPPILDKLGKIDIDSKLIVINKLLGIDVFLENVNINLGNLKTENIDIAFNQPNIVEIKADKIQGNGIFGMTLRFGLIKSKSNVSITLTNLDLSVNLSISKKESYISGKYLPYIIVSDVSLKNFKFDFTMDGSIIADIVETEFVKEKIKEYIISNISKTLTDKISTFTKEELGRYIKNMSPYYQINESGLAVDISLETEPKIESDFIIFNFNGAIVNNKIPSSKTIPFIIPEILPDYNIDGKKLQISLTDYAANAALNTLYLTKMLEYSINPEDIPENKYNIRLDTTYLDLLFNGLSKLYGKDKLAKISCKATSNPVVKLDKQMDISVSAECTIAVQLQSGEYDDALRFSTSIYGKGSVELIENGLINANIERASLDSMEMIETKIPEANIKNVEMMFNFIAGLIIPSINKLMKEYPIKMPFIEGLVMTDSNIKCDKSLAKLEVTPTFENKVRASITQTITHLMR